MSTVVGYLGPEGTFGYMAARRYYKGKRGIRFTPMSSHTAIIQAVGRKEVDFGVVAIENTIDGLVTETLHALEDENGYHKVQVCGETTLPIELYLMRKKGAVGPLRAVLTHSSPIRQCRRFVTRLRSQGVCVDERASTAAAAQEASNDPAIAAIASASALKKYGLEKIEHDVVSDSPRNTTRFWIIGQTHGQRSGDDKTCFLVNLEQSARGALYRALGCFVDQQDPPNLLIAYPHPIPGKPWEYTFLLEFQGHIDDENLNMGWERLRASGLCLNSPPLLGSYPSACNGKL